MSKKKRSLFQAHSRGRDQLAQQAFSKKGFLSPEVARAVARARAPIKPIFDLAHEASDLLQNIVLSGSQATAGENLTSQRVLAVRLMHRALSNFQGIILLVERGMDVQGRTLVRSCLEDCFCMAALLDNPEHFIEMFKADDQASRRAQAKVLLEQFGDTFDGADAEQVSRISALIDSIPSNLRTLAMPSVIKLGPLSKLHLAYKVFSNDAAHVSSTSLAHHIDMAEDRKSWRGYMCGPGEPARLADTLHYGLLAAFSTAIAFTQIIGDMPANQRISALTMKHAALSEGRRSPVTAEREQEGDRG